MPESCLYVKQLMLNRISNWRDDCDIVLHSVGTGAGSSFLTLRCRCDLSRWKHRRDGAGWPDPTADPFIPVRTVETSRCSSRFVSVRLPYTRLDVKDLPPTPEALISRMLVVADGLRRRACPRRRKSAHRIPAGP